MIVNDDLDRLRKTARIVNRLAWAVVVGIMVYGVPIVYGYLISHGIPKETAWMLSLIADGALAVGMVATPILAQYGVKAGWVGSLRWVAGFATWALNTAGSWFKEGGPDLGGVLSHTWGPLLMFFAVEAAAQFQRKIADVIRAKEASQKADDDRHRTATEQLRTATAELAEARATINQITEDAIAKVQRAEAEAASIRTTTERQIADIRAEAQSEVDRIRTEAEAEVGILRQRNADAEATIANLRAAAEHATAEHRATLAEVRAKAAEAVALAKAEARTTNISDYRTGGGRKTSGGRNKTTTAAPVRVSLSDEEAVQKCLAEHPEANYQWSQADIVKIVGCGWGRAPRLLEAIQRWHSAATSDTTTEDATDATDDTTTGLPEVTSA
ncbi:hypothetical protein GCM10011608_10290 [Micromonospora sonchi]|uniref:DUF2637 domain-containing protein n=1 Tax=Micromonospora sonchi TaxID=1763543 RepID=A0A917TMF1_9ACTN|nr:hypothetical protein [Micromonospora sonchi]GGM27476.1 hypothetical protein GCM10011608_10290 [Micromonospora sonchi]